MAMLRRFWIALALTVISAIFGCFSLFISLFDSSRATAAQAHLVRLWSRCVYSLARVRLEPERIEDGPTMSAVLVVIFGFIVFGWISFLLSFVDTTGRRQMWIAAAGSRCLLSFAGVKVETDGFQKIDSAAAYVFCANHASVFDIPVLLSSLPIPFRFLAYGDLFHIPLLGTHLTSAGHVPVPKGPELTGAGVLVRALRVIQKNGISLAVFPEGHLSRDGGLDTFRAGAALIAIKAQVPLVPLALVGTIDVMPRGSLQFRPGRVHLRMGDPISTKGLPLEAHGQVTEDARAQIAAMLNGDETGPLLRPENIQWLRMEECARSQQSYCRHSDRGGEHSTQDDWKIEYPDEPSGRLQQNECCRDAAE